MKSNIRRFFGGAVLMAGSLALAPAHAGTISFFLDADGNGATDNSVLVNEFVDLVGTIEVTNTFTDETNFTFVQDGQVAVRGVDGGSLPPSLLVIQEDLEGVFTVQDRITAQFTGEGSGVLGGALQFTSGTIEIFAFGFDDAIATFSIEGGVGNTTANGAPNGDITLVSRATSFKPGFFFSNVGGVQGADFSEIDLNTGIDGDDEGQLIFGFSTTNFSQTGVSSEGNVTTLTGGTNGQFRLTEVPSPASLALLGIGFIGLCGAVRSRNRRGNRQLAQGAIV